PLSKRARRVRAVSRHEGAGTRAGSGIARPPRAARLTAPRSLHVEQLDIEHQCRVRRNRPTGGAGGTVTELRRNRQLALASDLHARDALVPTTDDLVVAERELEWTLADRAVEL